MLTTFSDALEAARHGKRIARRGWNGKGMFVFMRPGDTLSPEIIANARSLPETVKAFLSELGRPIAFLPYLCMWSAGGEIVNGWLASQTDMLAEDWEILD